MHGYDASMDAWAAGFLDGEGYFAAADRGARSPGCYEPRIVASQVVRAPLERLQQMYGGHIQALKSMRNRQRPAFRWTLTGAKALRRVLPLLLPFLTVKRREAETLLALADTVGPRGGTARVPDEVRERRAALAAELVALRKAA